MNLQRYIHCFSTPIVIFEGGALNNMHSAEGIVNKGDNRGGREPGG